MKPTIKLLLFAISAVCLVACSESDDEPTTFEQDQALLAAELARIQSIASSVPCADSNDWDIIGYGAKPCGGPWGFLAYPTVSIDVEDFLQQVENYKKMNESFNARWGLGSDCSVPAQPSGVECENGKAVLVY